MTRTRGTTLLDPAFPRLHGRPSRGWVNDPNGCCFIDGRYHVFFQHNPKAPVHDAIAWGHMSSPDLVRWTEEPVALVPRAGQPDSEGCWTGCVVDDGGVPTALYSGIADRSGRSSVVLARSDRSLRAWTPAARPAWTMPDDDEVTDVRDPYVFHVDGRRYAVQGAGSPAGRPRILVHGCDDLGSWTDLGALLTDDDPVAARVAPANIWECPNLVPMGERWVLLVSLWRGADGGFTLAGTRYLVGQLTVGPEGPRFVAESGGELDGGPCFYAPQVLQVGDRTLMWAWAWEHDRSAADVAAAGWAGSLTFARELSLEDGRLVPRPVRELEGLRGEPLAVLPADPFDAAAYEVELAAGSGKASLVLADGAAESIVAEWEVPARPIQTPRVLVDGSMVEIFPGGASAYTTRAYPAATSRWVLRWTGASAVRGWRLTV